jgi:hypothetical protein
LIVETTPEAEFTYIAKEQGSKRNGQDHLGSDW